MTVLLEPTTFWRCPSCNVAEHSYANEAHRMHQCRAHGLQIPLVKVDRPDGDIHARNVINERFAELFESMYAR